MARARHAHIAIAVLLFYAATVWGQSTTAAETQSSIPPDDTIGQTVQSDVTMSSGTLHEFAYRQIELETQRLDKLIRNAEMVGKLMATLLIAFVAILSVFGYRSIKELKNELQASVESIVERILKDKSKSGESFEHLVTSLSSAQTRWATIEKAIDNLAKFETLSSSQSGDAQGAYRMAKDLSGKEDITADERRMALGYLLKILELGEQGRVDPNLLFNACSVASEMDFDHEALKLATLCAHWDPKPSHVLRKSRLEDAFGMRFELQDHTLVRSDQTPTMVRTEAWKVARDLARKSPTYQCELIFSELHNIAVRNRESGYIDDAIAVMEDVTKDMTAPSYAYAVLSGFYAMRGNSTWLADYLRTAGEAVKALSEESPASTWYDHTRRDIVKMAVHTNRTAEIAKILDGEGIPGAESKGLDQGTDDQ
jgi:hypothetical protein